MQLIALMGISEAETQLILHTVAALRTRGLKYQVDPGSAALARAGTVVVDGSCPKSISRWVALKAARPEAHGIVLSTTGGDAFLEDAADRLIERPLTARAFVTALGELDILRRPRIDRAGPGRPIGSQKRRLVASFSAPAASARQSATSRWRGRVLVVDDSETIRRQLKLLLAYLGVEMEAADTGELALHLVATHQYDAVLLDVMLPGADGYQICKTIKRNRTRAGLPVIMLTSKSSPFDRVRGSLAGCDSYLVKPTNAQRVEEALSRYLTRVPPAAAGGA